MKEDIMTSKRTYLIVVGVLAAIIFTLSAVAKNHGRSDRPAANDFGPGPRLSEKGLYVATLQGAKELQPRKMYTLQATLIDGKDGQPVTNAGITVDGGMPEHGHGLPTRPRVTKELGNGWYEISGLRFNMGGWWEVKLTITGPAGTDTVTFNLEV
ncbi:MAG: FixH family protein [Thermoanaerobaculia bacterium]